MPEVTPDKQKIFDSLVIIKDKINKQIPLAANRFVEFECPPLGEQDRDVDIQFYLHESLNSLMYLHYLAIEELRITYQTSVHEQDLPLSEDNLDRIKSVLALRLNATYAKMERVWRLRDKFNHRFFEDAKPKLRELMQSMLPGLCEQGEAALVLDEEKLIDLFIGELNGEITALGEKIMNHEQLTDVELNRVDRYRRENVPHEEEVNQLFNDLAYSKHFPDQKVDFSIAAIHHFLSDARFNIARLEEKLKARKHSYEQRYQCNNRLSQLRDMTQNNLIFTDMSSYLNSLSLQPDKQINKKMLINLKKKHTLQFGLFFRFQQIDTGYCDEHASIGVVELLENRDVLAMRIEKVSLSYADEDGHTFLVIGRAEASELNDMQTWGDEAILFDAWHQLVCYVKDLNNQGVQYRSFPKDAHWSSIEFREKDTKLLTRLKSMYVDCSATNTLDAEIRETRIKEEYGLIEIAKDSMLQAYLDDVVTQYRSANFKHRPEFYLINSGSELVKFVPGFRNPVIAIHKEVLLQLASERLSLTAFEFAITTQILQCQMHSSYMSPLAVSYESQQDIDIQAMKRIGSTEACIEYLRAATDFQLNAPLFTRTTLSAYERGLNDFELQWLTHFNFAERIKVLQASIAGGVSPSYNKDICYPSSQFHAHLMQLHMMPCEEIQFIVSDSENTATGLRQLIAQLPELAIELLPYETYRVPSIRLRQFFNCIQSLTVDYSNPIESTLVDQLIDEAHRLKLPGFESIYYAFASGWGVDNMGRVDVCSGKEMPYVPTANKYYVLRNENMGWRLFYVDVKRKVHAIALSEVDDLESYLMSLTSEPTYENGQSDDIGYLIHRYQGLRPLGFFKSIQQAITSFTLSCSYAEALERATELEQLRRKYEVHLADEECKWRQWKHKRASDKVFGERFFGSDLGKRIKWSGFDLSVNDSTTNPPYERFEAWAGTDASGIIAQTLFRLGLTNKINVVKSLTTEQLDHFSDLRSYQRCVFWGTLSGPHRKFMITNQFWRLPYWRDECASRALIITDSMFSDPTMSFEQAFIRFYDENLPGLISPYRQFNENHPAQIRLLQEFYRVALSGVDSEQEVVKSFFFGRKDKRDLKNLLTTSTLSLSTNYAQFVCLQRFNGQPHHLFDHYDIHSLYQLHLFNLSGYKDNQVTLEITRIALRVPEGLSLDNLVLALFTICDEKELKLYKNIISQYLVVTDRIVMFSEMLIKLIGVHQEERIDLSCEFLKKIKGTWPSIDDAHLGHISIDTLVKLYRFFDGNTLFPSLVIRSELSGYILDRIRALPELEKQKACYESWLYNKGHKLPLSDIRLKNNLIEELVAVYKSLYGIDDDSERYDRSINPLIIKLFEEVSNRDIRLMMSKLLTSIESQKKISEFVGMQADPGDYKMFSSKRYKTTRYGLIVLIRVADSFSEREADQEAFLNFISTSLSQTSLAEMTQYVLKHLDTLELYDLFDWSLDERADASQQEEKLRVFLTTLYSQFWDYSMYERAAVIEQVLIPSRKVMTQQLQTQAYEHGLSYLSNKLFPNAEDTTSDDYLALCIMKSYLRMADDYLRSYLLSAILVSANEHTGQEASMGKKLALVCEHMGPAYVKLAQAIHSHPKTTKTLRDDLAHVKSRANPPPRWSLLRQISAVLPPEDIKRIKRVGPLLGSASYNLALEVILDDDSQVVLLMLRENAEESARKGFAHIRATMDDCSHPTVFEQRGMIGETIGEAARLSQLEMSKEASDRQSQSAQLLYPTAMEFNLSGQKVGLRIKTANILKSGLGYRFIDKMSGGEFNSLPDAKPAERLVKRAVAKAVYLMELHNVLRGGAFDSDRHGNQLRVEVMGEGENGLQVQVGLYDFGEMALESPTDESLRQLAAILNRAPIAQVCSQTMDQLISEQINRAVELGQSTHYLMRLRKSFLAMQDFYPYLEPRDLVDVLGMLAAKPDIHPILQSSVNRLALLAGAWKGLDYVLSGVVGLYRGNRDYFFAPQSVQGDDDGYEDKYNACY